MSVRIPRPQEQRRSITAAVLTALVLGVLALLVLRTTADAGAERQVIFFDDFSVGDTTNIPGWDTATGGECGPDSSSNEVRDGYVHLDSGCGITRPGQDTAELQDIQLEYSWGYETTTAEPGELVVEWRATEGGAWQVLSAHALPGEAEAAPGQAASVTLPPEANDTFVDVRFRTTTGPDDRARVDNVGLSGEVVTPPAPTPAPAEATKEAPAATTSGDEGGEQGNPGEGNENEEEGAENDESGGDETTTAAQVSDAIADLNAGTANTTPTGAICESGDFSFVLDGSGSVASDFTHTQYRSRGFVDLYDQDRNGFADGVYKITLFAEAATHPAGASYIEDGAAAWTQLTQLDAPGGETALAAGIDAGAHLRAGVENRVMFVFSDGAGNWPREETDDLDDPDFWVEQANAAIAEANSARAAGMSVYAVWDGDADSQMRNAFGSLSNARQFAAAVMTQIGGGSYLSRGNFESHAWQALDLDRCDVEPEPVTRDITIEKEVAGDEPPTPVTEVNVDVSPHSETPYLIDIDDGHGNVTASDVADAPQAVTEDTSILDQHGGLENWTVEMAVIEEGQECSAVTDWTAGDSISVPAGEDDLTVCIRNTYTEPEPETRGIIIEAFVDDGDAGAIGQVFGSISPDGRTWTIDPFPGSTTVDEVDATEDQVVSQDSPGSEWEVSYALIDAGEQCDAVTDWQTGNITVPAGEDDAFVCVRNEFVEEPDPTRNVTIESLFAGDTPPSLPSSVGGGISPHGSWSIANPPGETTITGVSVDEQTVTQTTNLGPNWTVDYAVIDLGASCDAVSNWQSGSVTVPSGEDDYRVCVRSVYHAPPERDIIIEKIVAGDEPPSPLNSVTGTISGHGSWSISISGGSGTTVIESASTDALTVEENHPGEYWTVEYALAPTASTTCSEVNGWQSSPVTVPQGDDDYRVCIRNTYTEPPTFDKTGADYSIEETQARWTITITNPSASMQTVTIFDPVAPHIVGERPDACSGDLAGGLVCNVDAQSELTITVFKQVTQQCQEQTVYNTARGHLGTNGDAPHLPGSPAQEVPTTVPGDPDACEDLRIDKQGTGWDDGRALWTITIDNSEQIIPHDLTLTDPGAIASADEPACNLEEGDAVEDIDCVIEAGAVVELHVHTEAPRADSCEPGTTTNTVTAESFPWEQDELIFQLEYSIFAIQPVPGTPELCPAVLTVEKYIGEPRNADDLLDGPMPGDTPADGWQIDLVCGDTIYSGTTGADSDGTIVFELDPAPAGECTVSEVMQEGYSGIGHYLEDDGHVSAGVETTNIPVELHGDDDDLVIFFNKEAPDAPTPTPTTPPATETPVTETPVTETPETETPVTGTPEPTATPVDDPDATVTPGPPDTGAGFSMDGGTFGFISIVAAAVAILGSLTMVALARRRRAAGSV